MTTLLLFFLSIYSWSETSAPTEREQLNEALFTLLKDPNSVSAKLKGTEALLQLQHPLSAALLWQKMSEAQKKTSPQYEAIEQKIKTLSQVSPEILAFQETQRSFQSRKAEAALQTLTQNEFPRFTSESIRRKNWARVALGRWSDLQENDWNECKNLSCEIDLKLIQFQKAVLNGNFQWVLENQDGLKEKIVEFHRILLEVRKSRGFEEWPLSLQTDLAENPTFANWREQEGMLKKEIEFLDTLGKKNNYFFFSKIEGRHSQLLNRISGFLSRYVTEKPKELLTQLESLQAMVHFSKLKLNPELLINPKNLSSFLESSGNKVSRLNNVECLKANLYLLQAQAERTSGKRAEKNLYFLTKSKEILKGLEKKSEKPFYFNLLMGKVLFELEEGDAKTYLMKALPEKLLGLDSIEEINLLLAEAYFREGNFKQASNFYQQLFQSKNPTLGSYGHYKQGWIEFYESNLERALESFIQAVAASESFDKNEFLGALRTTLKKESLLFFSEKKDFSRLDLFSSLFSDESFNWGEALAKQFEEQGEFENSIRLYELLRKMRPEVCLAEDLNLLRVYRRLLRWNEIEKLSNHSREVHSEALSMETQGKSEKQWVEEIAKTLEEVKKSFAKDKVKLISFYQKILAPFGPWLELKPFYLVLANELHLQKKDEEALNTFRFYEKVYYEPGRRNEEPFLASYLQTLFSTSNPKHEGPLTFGEQEAIRLVTQEYSRYYPNYSFARPFWFNVQGLYLKSKKLELARETCQALFDENPADDFADKCFQNLRVSYYDSKDWELTYSWSTEILNRRWKSLERYEKPLKDIQKEALFLWAENEKDLRKSVTLFLQITNTPYMSSLWEKSYFNAISKLEVLKDKVRLLEVAEKMEKNFPYSTLTRKTYFIPARILAEAGDFDRAEVYLKKWANASEYEERMKAYAYLQLGKICESKGEKQEAQQWYSLYRRPETAVSAEGLAFANQRLQFLSKVADRRIASFETEKAVFLEGPISRVGSTPERVKKSSETLQNITKLALEVNSLDSICSLSVLYEAYAREVQIIILNETEKNREGLQKLFKTIDEKKKEYGSQCLKRAEESEEDTESFREVNQKYGWEWDAILSQRVKGLVQTLEKYLPRIDADGMSSKEEDILYSHLLGKEDGDTWYHLIFLRCSGKLSPYCRVTISKAAEKFSQVGKIQNAEVLFTNKNPKTPWLWKASQQGSRAALANIVYYHFKLGRLKKAQEALAKAMEQELFENNPEIKKLAEQWEKK